MSGMHGHILMKLLTVCKKFKVVQVDINRKPVCDFLLVINTDILFPTVSELSRLIVQILDTLRFSSHRLWEVSLKCIHAFRTYIRKCLLKRLTIFGLAMTLIYRSQNLTEVKLGRNAPKRCSGPGNLSLRHSGCIIIGFHSRNLRFWAQ